MTIYQFFIRQSQIDPDRRVKLDAPDVRHIRHVLRLEKGSKIRLVDEKQNVHLALIEKVNHGAVVARVLETVERSQRQTRLTVVHGIPKPPKTDFIVQKLTEIGVDHVVFTPADFTSYPNAGQKIRSRLDRLRKIATAAAKQSGRTDIPEIATCANFTEALEASAPEALLLVAHEKAHCKGIHDLLTNAKGKRAITLFIGPEGGLSTEEIQLLEENGATCFSLGRNILRTETASLIAAAIVLHELGEI
ncbi:MAG: 16S rRNA (uracil(1498)-N(3))-methyltransferase [Candidatus Lindowbacteria bacterium]|nr:16S rRNA (uracil(1498)-N(3))-methyltransferase [Candidatus Lindowbacteria bacterium]